MQSLEDWKMTKREAIKKFGSVTKLAKALGISRQAVYAWPEKLPQSTEDQIRGAIIRIQEERFTGV